MNTFRICRLSLTSHQFRFLAALGLICALVAPLGVPRARPWPASTWLEILCSSQVVGLTSFAAILWFIYLGLSSLKKNRAELRRYERLMLLFWGAYAGSSLSTLLGT